MKFAGILYRAFALGNAMDSHVFNLVLVLAGKQPITLIKNFAG
jgi:hypothetical protein